MNCRRIQEMIPLYVGGDLERSREELVSAHLRSCPTCNSVAGQYSESLEWIQSYRPPDFSSAFFDDLKRGVLGQIAQEESRPSFFQSIVARGSWNAVFAAVAVLVIVGSLVLNAYQRGLNGSPDQQELAVDPSQDETPAPRQESDAPTPEPKRRIAIRPRRPKQVALKETIAQVVNPVPPEWSFDLPTAPQTEVSESELPPAVVENSQPEESPVTSETRTRIELQTNDPNIRIIWFVPTDVTKLSNRRASDT